jgi:hypothetical protein
MEVKCEMCSRKVNICDRWREPESYCSSSSVQGMNIMFHYGQIVRALCVVCQDEHYVEQTYDCVVDPWIEGGNDESKTRP